MSNKKSDRIYNKDRIQRIKEASEIAKQKDPYWHVDAPPSIIPDDDDDMPITKMKTPPFLKEFEPNSTNSEKVVSKKLTLNELTQLNKDSSQLHDIMHSTNTYKGSKKNESKPMNYLELSRLKKVKERDDLNRQTAESLDQASERWHNQLKEYGKNKNTQDSTGIKSSLFADDYNEYEKSEHEKNEKRSGSRRFSSEFINKLDLLLQRGMRSSRMSRNFGGLRNINERSYNRWSNRFDKYSSMWDLRYPLLSNSLGAPIQRDYFNPDLNRLSFKPESKFQSCRNLFNDYEGSYNIPNQYTPLSSNSANINTASNMNPFLQNMPNTGYTPNFNGSNFNMYAMKDIPGQSTTVDQNLFFNSYNVQPQFPQAPVWQNPFHQQPFQQTYPNNVPVSQNNFPSNYIPPPQSGFHSLPNISTNVGTNAKSEDMNNSFESVTRKIDILAEKLEVLNVTLDKLKTNQARQGVKSIIKTHKNVNISSGSDKFSAGYDKIGQPINRQPPGNICNCPDCNSSKPDFSSDFLDRKVRFDPIDKEIKDSENSEINSLNSSATTGDFSNVLPKMEPSLTFPKAIHPRFIEQKYHSNSRLVNQFQSFQLPQELSKILQPDFKRSNYG